MNADHAELMEPLAELLRKSDKDLPTKVGVLVDLAGAILATSERMRRPSELRLTADEMRKRLIRSTRLHQGDLEVRQENARTLLAEAAKADLAVVPARGRTPVGSDQPDGGADR